jgi:hypothetical protein
VYTENSITKEKERLSEITLNPGNEDSTSQAVDWGLHTPSTSNIFTRLHSSILLLSNIVYSKGEHLSYSASVGKDMNAKAL